MDERDFKGEELKNGEKVAETIKIWKVEELGDNPEFKSSTTTYLDEDGIPVTEQSFTQYKADCGHWVIKPDQLTGKCSCGLSICYRCSSTRCRRCQTLLCPSCSRVLRVPKQVASPDGQVMTVSEETIFCQRCQKILLAGRIFRSLFGGMHRLFSEDISK